MKTSTERILTTHVGSVPRRESICSLLRARLGGQTIDETELTARAAEAVGEVVRRRAEVSSEF
jgi:5-methyltetrahydropteroyltriglutamate--homocysteine methyltransferase